MSFKFLKFEIITGPMCSDVFDIHLVYRKNKILRLHHHDKQKKIQIVFAGYYDTTTIPESDMPETDIRPKSIFLSLEGGDHRGTCSNCGRSYKNIKEFKRHLYRKRCHIHGGRLMMGESPLNISSNGASGTSRGREVGPLPMPMSMSEMPDDGGDGVGILDPPALPMSPGSYLKMEPPSPEIILRE